jgi:hypothetical protein
MPQRSNTFAGFIFMFLLTACGQNTTGLAPDTSPDDSLFEDNEVPSEMEVSDSRIDLIRGTWLLKISEGVVFESGSISISPTSRNLSFIQSQRITTSDSSLICFLSYRGEIIDTLNLLTGEELKAGMDHEQNIFAGLSQAEGESPQAISLRYLDKEFTLQP